MRTKTKWTFAGSLAVLILLGLFVRTAGEHDFDAYSGKGLQPWLARNYVSITPDGNTIRSRGFGYTVVVFSTQTATKTNIIHRSGTMLRYWIPLPLIFDNRAQATNRILPNVSFNPNTGFE